MVERRIISSYMAAGIGWQICVQAYWLLLFVRVSVELDFTPLELVLFGTAKEVAVLSFEIPTGVVADIFSRKWSVVIAFVISGVAIAGSGLLGGFVPLLVMAALWGFGLTFRSGAETAWLTAEIGSPESAEPILLSRAAWSLLAKIVGVIGAGLLATVTSLSTALTSFGVALVAVALGLSVAMPERNFVAVATDRRSAFTSLLRTGVSSARRIRPLRVLVVSTVVAGFGSEAVDRLYVRRLDELTTNSLTGSGVFWIGLITVAQALLGALALRVVVRRYQGDGIVPATAATLIVTAIGVFAFAIAGVLGVAVIGLIVAGAARLTTEPLRVAWANTWAPTEARATVHSFVGQAHSLGEIIGGVVLGTVATTAGLPAALTISAALYAVSASQVVTFRRT